VLTHTLGTAVRVSESVQPGIPALMADRGMLETALVNIGTNARDAMPNGGALTLSAAAEHVAVGSVHPAGLAPGDYVRLSVADSGIGMTAETLSRVSEPFFTTKPQGQGTGLGLAMVKGFAEQSGGALSITSTPGHGTTVAFWLPQALDEGVLLRDGTGGAQAVDAVSAHILLVDDDDLVRETLAASLEDMGFATLLAASGAEALALLEAGETVDAMVSDLSMPGLDGIVTIQRARALRPALPCFLLTGYVGDRATLSAEGAFTLVHKPITARALVAQIEAALEAGRQPRTLTASASRRCD
jgi:CheY-like chemotaxis protein